MKRIRSLFAPLGVGPTLMLFACMLVILAFLMKDGIAQTPVPATPAPLPNMTRGETPLLQSLAGFKITVHAGAAAATNIPITGITTADSILSVLQTRLADANDPTLFVDRTSETYISAAGNIKLTTTNTSTNQLIVYWYDHDAYSLGQ